MRALDHLVLATRDLPRMASRFAALGFQVGRRNRHPWGTENHIIQFRSTFLEIVGLAADYRSLSEDDPAFPFAGFIERYLDRNVSGIAMAVLRSSDAAADALELKQNGIGSGRMLPFSRSARAPDGSDRTVAFTVAFAEAPSMSSVGFFTCEQHRPENFWNDAFQQHANTAREITGFDLVSKDPTAAVAFLTAFAGSSAKIGSGDRAQAVLLDGGSIRITQDQTGGTAASESRLASPVGPYIAAMTVELDRLPQVESGSAADEWHMAADQHGSALLCSPADAATFVLRMVASGSAA